MQAISFYSANYILDLTRKREGETKLGEEVLSILEPENYAAEISNTSAKFVLLGLPEDIGVRANFGRAGAASAWKPALESFLNTQSNQYLNGKDILVLGHVNFDDLNSKAEHINPKEKSGIEFLRKMVEYVDTRVLEVVKQIVSSGKIPIIIGGGHNNAYPNIKACSEGLKMCEKQRTKGINVINCDAHADFRPLEGRHSGNGFSYAYEENILKKYAVLGIHESYNTEKVIEKFNADKESLYQETYENIFVRNKLAFDSALENCISFCNDCYCGIELDMDSITNVPSSAKTSSGLSPVQARQFIYESALKLKACYFHVAEAAPILSHIKMDNKTGKLIANLIADFIKGVKERELNLN